MSVHFEQTILGASLYYNKDFICSVSGMEESKRLKDLLDSKDSHILNLEGALRELVDAVKSMDMRKQKEVIYLCSKLLQP